MKKIFTLGIALVIFCMGYGVRTVSDTIDSKDVEKYYANLVDEYINSESDGKCHGEYLGVTTFDDNIAIEYLEYDENDNLESIGTVSVSYAETIVENS